MDKIKKSQRKIELMGWISKHYRLDRLLDPELMISGKPFPKKIKHFKKIRITIEEL